MSMSTQRREFHFWVSGTLRVEAHCDLDAEAIAVEAARELGLTDTTVCPVFVARSE